MRRELRGGIAVHLEELTRAIAEGRSDEFHFATVRSRFFSQYVRSWMRELRVGGPRVLVRKFMNLRPYHAQLIGRAIFGKLWSGRRE